jgi:hypothetical protein
VERARLIVLAVAVAWGCDDGTTPDLADADGDAHADADADVDLDAADASIDADEAIATCVDPTCSGHGACEVGDAVPACACDDGFDGDDCSRCAAGYQDNDGDGTCRPGCASLACGPHGSCNDAGGAARCLCAEGWQDNDEDGVCGPACASAGLECEPRQWCDDSSGLATCVCERGWAGDDCASCAPGFERVGAPGGERCEPDHAWAVLVYMAADGDLEPFARADLDELAGTGSSDDVHVVVLLDPFLEPAQTFYVEPGELVAISEPGEVDTGDYRTLRDFGAWAVAAYPARHTALVLWGHGGGWAGRAPAPSTRGFGFDEHGSAAGISISNGDFGRALQGIAAALGGQRIDVLGFDACRMGAWEVAVAAAPHADVLVASSDDEPLDGWSYVGPLRALRAEPELDPFDLAAALVEAYASESPLHLTLAATDLGAIHAVTAAVDGLAGALLAHPERADDVEAVRLAAQGFGDPAARDLWDVAQRIAAIEGAPADVVDAADIVVRELALALIESRSQPSLPGAHGLSISLPARGSGMDPAYAAPAAPWSATRWDDFLAMFTAE